MLLHCGVKQSLVIYFKMGEVTKNMFRYMKFKQDLLLVYQMLQ